MEIRMGRDLAPKLRSLSAAAQLRNQHDVYGRIVVEARPDDQQVVAGRDELRHVDGLRGVAVRDDARRAERTVPIDRAQHEIRAAALRGAPPRRDGGAVALEQQTDLAERARTVELERG